MALISALNYNNISHNNFKRPSFGASMNAVRYVIVDGHVVEDKSVIESVTKQLVKSAKASRPEDIELRRTIKQAIPEYSLQESYQDAKFLKLNMLGKEFNVIMGQAATNLRKIWEQAGVSLITKKNQASNLVKSLIYDKASKHIAIDAVTVKIKGKVKYLIKKIYVTV